MNVGVVENITLWVGKMLRMFGLGEGESTELGWGQDNQGEGSINVSAISTIQTFISNPHFIER